MANPATRVETSASARSPVESLMTEPSVGDTASGPNDQALTLDSDEIRDQMAAQVKATRVKFTSKASIQMLFFLFVAYCSELLMYPQGRDRKKFAPSYYKCHAN